MKIAIAGPIATENITSFLDSDSSQLPLGYRGAPLLATLIGELLARGHEVSAYTTSPNLPLDLPQPLIARGDRFKIYYCPVRKHSMCFNGKHVGRIVDFFHLERRYLEQAIRMDNSEVVHAHWAYEFALATISSGKPHVLTCHDAPQEILKYMPNLYRLGRYFMARKAMKTAQKLTTVSPYMRDSLKSFTHQEIEVIPNPLPLTVLQRTFDQRRKLSTIEPIIAMAANGWDKRKNPQVGLRAFAKLRSTLKNARLFLFGNDFGNGGMAHDWAQKERIDEGMMFVGSLPYEQLLEQIAKADVFLHPSLEESFGMIVAEAMALGVPVIGGKSSGAVPWLIGGGGILTDVNNPNDITNALISILSAPEHWQQTRTEAYNSAQTRFSVKVVVDAYENLYHQLLKGSSQ